jgi:hypothetical protein
VAEKVTHEAPTASGKNNFFFGEDGIFFAKSTFFHAEITFFQAGITLFHTAASSAKKVIRAGKQELNSSETSCDRVGGLKEGVVKKPVSAWWKEVWLKK